MTPNVSAMQTRVRQYRRLSALATENDNPERAKHYEQRADSLTRTLVALAPLPERKSGSWHPTF